MDLATGCFGATLNVEENPHAANGDLRPGHGPGRATDVRHSVRPDRRLFDANTLEALPRFPPSVRDIRAFRIEQWSDFTTRIKGLPT